MGTFKIEGGIQLKGDVQPQGAKNEALQVLCPALLTSEKVTISNIPDIVDINKYTLGVTNYGERFSAVLQHKNILACPYTNDPLLEQSLQNSIALKDTTALTTFLNQNQITNLHLNNIFNSSITIFF